MRAHRQTVGPGYPVVPEGARRSAIRSSLGRWYGTDTDGSFPGDLARSCDSYEAAKPEQNICAQGTPLVSNTCRAFCASGPSRPFPGRLALIHRGKGDGNPLRIYFSDLPVKGAESEDLDKRAMNIGKVLLIVVFEESECFVPDPVARQKTGSRGTLSPEPSECEKHRIL